MSTSSHSSAVMITGATGGLGRSLARRLARERNFGKVVLTARNAERGTAPRDRFQSEFPGLGFAVSQTDLASLASVRAAAAQLEEPLGAIVLNAGGTGGAQPRARTMDGVSQMFAANVVGQAALVDVLLSSGLLRGNGRVRREGGGVRCARTPLAGAGHRRRLCRGVLLMAGPALRRCGGELPVAPDVGLPRQVQRRQKPHRVRPLVAARARSRGGQIHYALPTGGKDGVGLPGQPGVVGRLRGDRDPLARGKPGDLNRDGLVRQRHGRAGGDLRMPRRAAAAAPGQRPRPASPPRTASQGGGPGAAQHGEAEGAKAWTRSRTSSTRERGAFPASHSPTLVRQPLALRLRPPCPATSPTMSWRSPLFQAAARPACLRARPKLALARPHDAWLQ
jgi:hypothetical protein